MNAGSLEDDDNERVVNNLGELVDEERLWGLKLRENSCCCFGFGLCDVVLR